MSLWRLNQPLKISNSGLTSVLVLHLVALFSDIWPYRRAVEGSLAIRGVFGNVNVVNCEEDTTVVFLLRYRVVGICHHHFASV